MPVKPLVSGCNQTLVEPPLIRTAFVATRLFGKRRLDRYPLDATMRARLDDGDPGSVLFAGTGQQGTPWSANLGRRRYSSSSFPAGPAGFPAA